MPTKLSVEQIKGEVQRFWNVFNSKDAGQLADFYAPESSVFSSVANRLEPGRLAAARRQREYFQGKSKMMASTGAIDVVLLGDNAAVAGYNFQFHASRIAGATGQVVEEDIKQGRATQVFAYGHDGKLRIMHEHLSSVDKA